MDGNQKRVGTARLRERGGTTWDKMSKTDKDKESKGVV